MVCHDGRPVYTPRGTASCDAVQVVSEHLPGFFERLEQGGARVPSFVRAELEAFTRCGDFGHGFVLLACTKCGERLRVPFACKARGICPSCTGRRMAETAALLVDHRLPAVFYRQWVLSFPGPMSVRLGYDTGLPRFDPKTPVQLEFFTPTGRPRATLRVRDRERSLLDRPSRLAWAQLLARTFDLDLTRCPVCTGPLRIREVVTSPEKIRAHLEGARGPPKPRPSPPGQLHLFAS